MNPSSAEEGADAVSMQYLFFLSSRELAAASSPRMALPLPTITKQCPSFPCSWLMGFGGDITSNPGV